MLRCEQILHLKLGNEEFSPIYSTYATCEPAQWSQQLFHETSDFRPESSTRVGKLIGRNESRDEDRFVPSCHQRLPKPWCGLTVQVWNRFADTNFLYLTVICVYLLIILQGIAPQDLYGDAIFRSFADRATVAILNVKLDFEFEVILLALMMSDVW